MIWELQFDRAVLEVVHVVPVEGDVGGPVCFGQKEAGLQVEPGVVVAGDGDLVAVRERAEPVELGLQFCGGAVVG